jgi:hypothetical protein
MGKEVQIIIVIIFSYKKETIYLVSTCILYSNAIVKLKKNDKCLFDSNVERKAKHWFSHKKQDCRINVWWNINITAKASDISG